jgi:hypothetical protein
MLTDGALMRHIGPTPASAINVDNLVKRCPSATAVSTDITRFREAEGNNRGYFDQERDPPTIRHKKELDRLTVPHL